MGKWGCRGIPLDGQEFHHVLLKEQLTSVLAHIYITSENRHSLARVCVNIKLYIITCVLSFTFVKTALCFYL